MSTLSPCSIQVPLVQKNSCSVPAAAQSSAPGALLLVHESRRPNLPCGEEKKRKTQAALLPGPNRLRVKIAKAGWGPARGTGPAGRSEGRRVGKGGVRT